MITDYDTTALAVMPRSSSLDTISFLLNFENMHQWHPLYTSLYMKNHDGGNDMTFDYMEVSKYLVDARDVLPAPNRPVKIQAELLADGRGMVVSEPMLATYYETDVKQVNVKEPFNQAKKVAYIEQTVKHKAADVSARIRKTYIYFPNNIIGTTEHIGGVEHSLNKSTQLELSFNIFKLATVYDLQNTVVTQAAYAYWKIGVKGSEKIMEFDDTNKTSVYAQTLLGMKDLGLVENKDSMSNSP